MKYTEELIDELKKFAPKSRLTDESGIPQDIELSFRNPATMCGILVTGTDSQQDHITRLETAITDALKVINKVTETFEDGDASNIEKEAAIKKLQSLHDELSLEV